MKRVSIALVIIAGILLANAGVSHYRLSQTMAADQSVETTLSAGDLWEKVEAWRMAQGYKPYVLDQDLCTVASIRAEEIQTDWSHNGFTKHLPDGYYWIGENLAEGYASADATLTAWLNSPEHRRNLTDFHFTASCIVVLNDRAVQTFAGN